jgi:hypothetical protein
MIMLFLNIYLACAGILYTVVFLMALVSAIVQKKKRSFLPFQVLGLSLFLSLPTAVGIYCLHNLIGRCP